MTIVETLTDPGNLLPGFIALVVLATIVTLASPLRGGKGLEGRLKSVASRREDAACTTRAPGAAARPRCHQPVRQTQHQDAALA